MSDTERLTRLEERYAHLQRHVTEQDKAMLALGDELARLRTELAALHSRQNAGLPAGEPGAADERPPHY
jgi:SlyX protein